MGFGVFIFVVVAARAATVVGVRVVALRALHAHHYPLDEPPLQTTIETHGNPIKRMSLLDTTLNPKPDEQIALVPTLKPKQNKGSQTKNPKALTRNYNPTLQPEALNANKPFSSSKTLNPEYHKKNKRQKHKTKTHTHQP